MNNHDLLRLDGFRTVGTEQAGDGLIVDVELIVPEIHPCRCGDTRCKKHGKRPVQFKDFPLQRQTVTIRIKRQRWRCEGCGAVLLEKLPGIDADRNMTIRFRNALAADAVNRTFTDAANMHGVKETLVRRVFKEYADEQLTGYVPTLPRVLGMDEKFIHGRARFVIGDVEAKTLLDIRQSRKNEDLVESRPPAPGWRPPAFRGTPALHRWSYGCRTARRPLAIGWAFRPGWCAPHWRRSR